MHRGAMVVPCRTRGALRNAGPGGTLACARHHVLVPVRPVGGRVPFRVGGGGLGARREDVVFPVSHGLPVGVGGIAGMRMI